MEELNLWDVLFDFVIIDAFEDLRKPPSSITALIKNSWLGYSMKEAAVNNIVWSLIKVKRSRLQYTDGFITRFYDISHILTTPLTLGLLGGSPPEFEEICIFFKVERFDLFDLVSIAHVPLVFWPGQDSCKINIISKV